MKQDQILPLGITSAQVNALLRYNSMNIFSSELTDGSTLKAATCVFLDVDLRYCRNRQSPETEEIVCNALTSALRFAAPRLKMKN